MYPPKFTRQIFMGAAEHSELDCYRAHKLLDKCLEMLGGIQQQGLQGSAIDEKAFSLEDRMYEREVEQLILALTGKTIKLEGL